MNEIAKYLTKSQMSNNDIQQVIAMIDQESANSIYRRCAEEFGFKVVEVEGYSVSVARELAPVFGYSGVQGTKDVLRVLFKNGISTLSCASQNGMRKFQEEFALSSKDHNTKMIDYRGFLTVALEGQGSACDKVREYLLKMETKARVDSVVYETTGLDAADFQEVAKYAEDPIMQSMMEGQRRMKEIMQLRAQQLETQERVKAIETTLEEKVSITPKQEETILKRRDELISLQVQNGKDRRKAYAIFTRNIKERFRFGMFCGLERSKFNAVLDWTDNLITQEREKLAQLDIFRPKVVSMR